MSEAILRTKLTGDGAELHRALREGIEGGKEFASRMTESMREIISEIAVVTIGFYGIGSALEKTIEGVRGIFEMSKELEHLSDRTGIAVKDLMMLQAEFKLSGLQADEVGSTINKMQRSIENASDKGGAAAQVFSRLGLNLYELRQLNPAAQFDAIKTAISGIEDPARRAQVAMQIFGKGGGGLNALFGNKNIGAEASEALGGQQSVMARYAELFQEIQLKAEQIQIKMQGFFMGLAAPLGEVILPILNKIEGMNFEKWGSQIGASLSDAVRILYNAFDQGKIGTLLVDSIEYGSAKGANFLVAAIQTAFDTIQPIINGIFANDNFADGLLEILTGAAGQFGAALVDAFKLPIQVFEYGMLRAAGKVIEAMATGARILAMVNPIIMGKLAEEKATGVPGWATSTMGSIGGMASNLENKGNAIGNVSFDQWKSKSNNDFFLGTNGSEIAKMARTMSQDGIEKMSSAFTTIGENLKRNVGMKITDIFGAEAAGGRLSDDLSGLKGAIPGEGKATEEKPGASDANGGRDFAMGNLNGIHKGQDGWVSFDKNNGMAGRAGRVTDNPNGPSQGDMLKTALDYLKQISGAVTHITEPA